MAHRCPRPGATGPERDRRLPRCPARGKAAFMFTPRDPNPALAAALTLLAAAFAAGTTLLAKALGTGIGRGAFASVYPVYKTLEARVTFTHAENEVFQTLIECGWPVGLVVLGALLAVLVWQQRAGDLPGVQEDWDILASGEELELIEELEFYDWLEQTQSRS